MKRFLVAGLMIFALFALAACGGNDNATQQQAETSSSAGTVSGNVLRFDTPFQGERWDNEPWLSITIHSDYTIVTVDSVSYDITRVIDGERVSDTTNEFVMLRVTLTNTNESRTLGTGGISMRNPYFGLYDGAWHIQDPGRISIVSSHNVFNRFYEQQGINVNSTRGVEPGITEERYLLFPFVGDGEYSFVVSYDYEETRSASQLITVTINH